MCKDVFFLICISVFIGFFVVELLEGELLVVIMELLFKKLKFFVFNSVFNVLSIFGGGYKVSELIIMVSYIFILFLLSL